MNSPHARAFGSAPSALLVALGLLAGWQSAMASDWIVSANDAKYVRVEGQDTYPENVGPDTLTLLDAAHFPPLVTANVEIHHTLIGPPQAVAINPSGTLAIVAAPNYYDRVAQKPVFETYLQVVDFAATPARVIDRIELGTHPQGLSINREGTLALAADLDGTVAVLAIDGNKVTLLDKLKLSDHRLSGISFTHDGKAALVALRDDQGLLVLDVNGNTVSNSHERIASGVAPYSVDVSSDGHWAVVSNAGLAALPASGHLYADADSFTLIDVSQRPFRAVQQVTVPSVPEGIAISPDGRWVAVQSMDGSNLTSDNPGRHARGRVLLFEIRNGEAIKRSDLAGGEAAQGIVFTADSRGVLVQFNVEKQLACYRIDRGQLKDTGVRIPIAGGPASLRSTPR